MWYLKSHRECEHHEEQPRKRQKITDNQEKYDNEMVTQSQENQPRKFKVGDIVSIKIDRVDKTSRLHSNLILGKIEEIVVNTYICPCCDQIW